MGQICILFICMQNTFLEFLRNKSMIVPNLMINSERNVFASGDTCFFLHFVQTPFSDYVAQPSASKVVLKDAWSRGYVLCTF